MRCLPFFPQSFAAVWCQAALLHLPKTLVPTALGEISRVLTPGGLFHVAVQKGENEGFETRPYEPVERYYAYYQPEELSGMLQNAGFRILHLGEAQARRLWLDITAQKSISIL
jgi:ubiquinone/menaquinone biosynthesis C-methylase UbiE